MKLNDMFPTRFATGADLQGREVSLIIETVRPEKMRPGPGQPEATKFVVYFVNAKKGVVLNKTLAEQIAQAVGSDDTDNWSNKAITLYPENIHVAGVARVAIRAKAANGRGG